MTATYPKTDPSTEQVPAQPEDDPMITGVVLAQPGDPPPTGTTPAQPSGPPAVTDLLQNRTVSGSVPPTPPPAAKDETPPNLKISSRPVSPLQDPLTTANVAATATISRDRTAQRRLVLLVGALVVVLVVVAVGAYFAFGANSKAGASEQVANAARHTLHKKSVDLAFSMKVATTGSSTPAGSSGFSGTGAFDFASGSGTISLTAVGGGSQGTEQLVFVGKTVYVSFPDVSVLEPGKSWVSADSTQLSSVLLGIGSDASAFEQLLADPAASVHQLQSSGLAVTALGASTYEGTPVQGYAVLLSRSATHGVAGVHGSETLYVTSKHLLRAIVVPVTVTAPGGSFSETFTMGFSNYGAPVTATPPPAAQVVSFTQYESIQNAAT